MNSPSTFAQLKSIALLPFVVAVIIPFVVLCFLNEFTIVNEPGLWLKLIGVILFSIGFPLFIQSVVLFIKIGKGTLAPWNPTKKLVVKSLYRYTRNPMILGVLFILLSESFWFNSLAVLIWSILFFMINQVYFILKEEPDLKKKFGQEYEEYCENVPRWIPRIKGWKPEENGL